MGIHCHGFIEKELVMSKLVFLALFILPMGISGQKISIDPDLTMLALGDSYTIGESVELSQRWPHQFVAELRKAGIRAEDPDYIATTGWTTKQLIKGIETNLKQGKKYKLVSILIGVNNQYQGIDISTYEPDLKYILSLALEFVSHDTSKVFMLSIPDYAFTPFGAGRSSISGEIDIYNAINSRLAKEYNIAYIDITAISRKGLDDATLVAEDGLHPSGAQYGEWVRKIIPLLSFEEKLKP